MRRTPAALRLQDVTPERHLAEDPADRPRLVASARVRQRVGRVVGGMEAAIAGGARDWMGSDRRRERILVEPALGHNRAPERPQEVVEDGAEP
jgi:hypothetical protein